ncbi:hypothetical protein [Microaceticoccus formicicus]|uniref:hypothetical protein n=1 Tax=Microaceticoccus formicicus TaxID=3118105 RepID=UPI003CD032FF|nr:hypothetical protein VZL98_04010 [Peptoniphilaceae bacterium AMB_02]
MYFDVEILDTYKTKNEVEKLDFWDRQLPLCNFKKQNSKQLVSFIHQIIADSQETIYSKCQAIDFSMRMFLADILKDRNILDILLDSWEPTSDIHLETLRIKRLALLYPYDTDIHSVLNELAQNDSLVSTESNYQLGLINLFVAREKGTIDEVVEVLRIAYDNFDVASKEENRIDANLFKIITNSIIYIFCNNWLEFDKCIKELEYIIFIQRIYSWNPDVVTLHRAIYSKLFNAKLIIEKDTRNWINYKAEFDQLCLEFFNIQNQSVKSDLFSMEIEYGISDNLITKVIEPVFKTNFKSVLCKIDCLLDGESIEEKQAEFLIYLKNVIQQQSEAEISEYDFFNQSIIKNFPHLAENKRRIFYDAIKDSNLQIISNMLDQLLNSNGYDKLIERIMHACVTLQGTRHYYGSGENVRNKFIAQLLEASGFCTKDQTQWGLSNKGISDGEIDVQIVNSKGTSYSIIEGLILKSLDTTYLNLHLNKIFKYDTTGLEYIFIVSYVAVSNFSSFWSKYCEHIRNHDFQYPLDAFEENVYKEKYSEIKTGRSSHQRNGTIVYLYHICIKMP